MAHDSIRVLAEVANRQIRSLAVARAASDRGELLLEIDRVLEDSGAWLEGPQPVGALPDLDGGAKASGDGAAAVALHRSLSRLTRVEASDSRLWNALGLTIYREYVEERWENGNSSFEAWVQRRLLPVEVGSMRSLARHALSRLWWTAHVLHDPYLTMPLSREVGDPYAYVTRAFAVEDIRAGMMERNYWGINGFPLLLLETLRKLEAEGVEMKRDQYRAFLSRSLIMTGHTRVDYMIAANPADAAERMAETARAVFQSDLRD